MKKLVAMPLPKEPVFEVELPIGTEVLRVGVIKGQPYIGMMEPQGGVIANEKRRFLTVPLGVTIRMDEVDFIGSFCGGEVDFYIFEVKGVMLHSPNEIQPH